HGRAVDRDTSPLVGATRGMTAHGSGTPGGAFRGFHRVKEGRTGFPHRRAADGSRPADAPATTASDKAVRRRLHVQADDRRRSSAEIARIRHPYADGSSPALGR